MLEEKEVSTGVSKVWLNEKFGNIVEKIDDLKDIVKGQGDKMDELENKTNKLEIEITKQNGKIELHGKIIGFIGVTVGGIIISFILKQLGIF